ncbi:MAG: hypothetical protein GY820_31530 [Gammaproteobacteria bacterium]|nr:hypothetical protein [Gammaproteobacteria bacterium]
MFLKKLMMVNWGNLPNGEFEFGPVNLMSGRSGSGKTTAADLIQTIMTAAHENLFQYNPGQDETTQRGRGGKKVRTLSSYILGCDDGSYARLSPTDGYLSATFAPTRGETGDSITALIAVRAWLETAGQNRLPKEDELVFFILTKQQDIALELSHLQPDNQVLKLEHLSATLIHLFGKSCVEKYDTKKRAYLRRLYGVLRGRPDSVTELEAMSAAKAFSRFMAYKPVQSINRFVADEILEKKDLGEAIRSISGQLKTIHGMERDADRIQQSVDKLEQAQQAGQYFLDGWRDLQLAHYCIAKHGYRVKHKEYLKAKDKEKSLNRDQVENDQKIVVNEQRVSQLHDQRINLEAQRLGIPALQQKDKLERQRDVQHKQITAIGMKLLGQRQLLDEGVSATRQIVRHLQSADLQQELPHIAELDMLASAKQLLALNPENSFNIEDMMSGNIFNNIEKQEQNLDRFQQVQNQFNQWQSRWFEAVAGDKPLTTQVANYLDRLETAYRQAQKDQQQKQNTVEKLQQQRVAYPDYVERALQAINNLCSKADARVLCDHVEVTDKRWQAAIEGYLGGARFSILVDGSYEAEAIRIVRGLPGRRNPTRIIQGKKAEQDAQRVSLDSDSIVNIMQFTHGSAKHFLTASYGSVVRVKDEQQLRMIRRGVTMDCLASGNYAMFRCDINESDLVFGAEARKRALLSQQAELQKLTNLWNGLNNRMLSVSQLNEQLGKLKRLELVHQFSQVLSCHRELQKIENLLSQIDLADHQELEQKLTELAQEESARKSEYELLFEARGRFKTEISSLVQSYQHLGDELEKFNELVDLRENDLQQLHESWPDFDIGYHLDQADEKAKTLDLDFAENALRDQGILLHQHERDFCDSIRQQNQICLPGDAVVYESYTGELNLKLFRHIANLCQQIDRIFNRLKNNVLLEKHGQLKHLKDSFNHTFVSNLCHSIHQAINDGKRQIELLNTELQNHRFGDDRETFRFAYQWVAEFREYARFFEDVIRNPELNDGITLFAAKLKPESVQVRDKLMTMLLDEDADKALRELARIADYRNYRQYEIYKEVEGKPPIALSEYGTGSGGQLETPAYIIRAAAITSAFRFAEGSCHLRTVLVDEAFSKMDETRSREVINYLTESLGLQLIFIMPTSKCGPFMDLISNEFVFAKCPSAQRRGELNTRVLVDRKVCNREKIKALWASHKRMVYRQAEIDFLDDLTTEDA